MRLVLPMPGDIAPVCIDGPLPLTVEEWDYLQRVLETMKPALVRDGVRSGEDMEIVPRPPEDWCDGTLCGGAPHPGRVTGCI